MDDVLDVPAFDGATTGVWNLLVDFLARVSRRIVLSKSERELLEIVEASAACFGEPLLTANSLDDLDERIDAIVEDSAYADLNAKMLSRVATELKARPPIEPVDATAWCSVLGDGMADLMATHFGMVVAIYQEIGRQFGRMKPEELRKLRSNPAIVDPRVCLHSAPVEIARIFLNWWRADVCMLAVLHVALNHQKPEPWRARAIAERMVAGTRGYLRLLASLPNSEISQALVSPAERLDLARIQSSAERVEKEQQHRREVMDLSGVDVYPPLEDD